MFLCFKVHSIGAQITERPAPSLLKMPSAEDAIALKQKGNQAVAAHEWLNAIDFYSQAIEINDKDPTFFCNRAQVNHKIQRFGLLG